MTKPSTGSRRCGGHHPKRRLTIARPRFADEEGISLVEMLIAIVLLGVIMGGMVQSLAASLFSVQRQERHVHATALAAELLESAVSLPWSSIGLCDSAATTAFGGTEYTYSGTDTEPLVLFPDVDVVCTGGPPMVPNSTLVRPAVSGNPYDVETVVTWHDDVQDDVSGSDPNTVQDLKRIQVTISWDVQGDALSYTAETFRAPGGAQLGIHTRVDHAGTLGFTYLHDASTLTKTDVYLRLFAGTPQSAVSVSWEANDNDGDGQPETVTRAMVNPSSDRLTWQFLIPNGSPEFAGNDLPNAQILFTFTATGVNTDPTVVLDRGLFLIEPLGPGTGHRVESVSVPDEIRLRDGVLCPFVVETEVRGALGSDPITISWSPGPPAAGLATVSSLATGATFEASFGADTPGFVLNSVANYTITAERPADSQLETATGQVPVVEWEEGDPC